MLQVISLDRKTRNYSEILDVCEFLQASEYGSAANALAALVRRSPLYQEVANSKQFAAWLKDNAEDVQISKPPK